MTMVGALESLNEPLVGFVRLAHAVVMPNLMEIQIPVRFIFVLLTPFPSLTMDCHEIGRAFSALMSNKVSWWAAAKPLFILDWSIYVQNSSI